jgi:hypothetical protein
MTTSKKRKSTKAKDFDKAFEKGDVNEYLDLASVKARYPVHRISIDFTQHIVEQLDNEAARIGVTRTALIKIWVAERLEEK